MESSEVIDQKRSLSSIGSLLLSGGCFLLSTIVLRNAGYFVSPASLVSFARSISCSSCFCSCSWSSSLSVSWRIFPQGPRLSSGPGSVVW